MRNCRSLQQGVCRNTARRDQSNHSRLHLSCSYPVLLIEHRRATTIGPMPSSTHQQHPSYDHHSTGAAARSPPSPAASSTTLAHGEDDAHLAPPASGMGHPGTEADETDKGGDIEEGGLKKRGQGHGNAPVDIEHLEVVDDPRLWSRGRKNAVLACVLDFSHFPSLLFRFTPSTHAACLCSVIALTAVLGTVSGSIFFRALRALLHLPLPHLLSPTLSPLSSARQSVRLAGL